VTNKPVPVRDDGSGKWYYYNEIFGRTQMYDILSSIKGRNPVFQDIDIDVLVNEIQSERANYEPEDIQTHLNWLRRIHAIRDDDLGITDAGKKWFSSLQEINNPSVLPPLEIIPPGERPGVPVYFLKNVLIPMAASDSVKKLAIVSPWIGLDGNFKKQFVDALSRISSGKSLLSGLVIAKPPSPTEQYLADALDAIANTGIRVYTNKNLHAKIYAIENVDKEKSIAIIGSANLTQRASTDNYEVGLVIRGMYDRNFELIQELLTSAISLKGDTWR
jgi:hypothetical protein